ncbi:MAG: hypothetical protein ACE5OR_16265 [bacterium]
MGKTSLWKVLVVALVLGFVLSPVTFASDRAQEQMVIPDLLIGRPLGALALAAGFVTYAITLPITVPFGWRAQAKEALVNKPYRFTFERDLGEGLKGY